MNLTDYHNTSDRRPCKALLKKLDEVSVLASTIQLDEVGSRELPRYTQTLNQMRHNLPIGVQNVKVMHTYLDKWTYALSWNHFKLCKMSYCLKRLEEKHGIQGIGDPVPQYNRDALQLGGMATARSAADVEQTQQRNAVDDAQALAALMAYAAAYRKLVAKTEEILVAMDVVKLGERTDLLPSQRGKMKVDERLGLQLRCLADRVRTPHEDLTTEDELGPLLDGKLQKLQAEEAEGVIVIMVLEFIANNLDVLSARLIPHVP